MPEITVKFEPRDLWIGIFWTYSRSVESAYRKLTVYVCVIPTLPIRIRWEWGWKENGMSRKFGGGYEDQPLP